MNEASDYEIMHLAMRGELPTEKFDSVREFLLFSELKEQMLINYESISTILEPQDIAIFMESVGPVYPEMSTALPVLEHYLSEVSKEDIEKGVGDAVEKGKKAYEGAKKVGKEYGDAAMKKGEEGVEAVKKGYGAAKQTAGEYGDAAMKKGEEGVEAVKKGYGAAKKVAGEYGDAAMK
jgi:hypothetical protein